MEARRVGTRAAGLDSRQPDPAGGTPRVAKVGRTEVMRKARVADVSAGQEKSATCTVTEGWREAQPSANFTASE